MGIPKYYRWVSERYPLLNTVITEDTHPQFDNLYLDMNGIIHNCARARDNVFRSNIMDETVPVEVDEKQHILRIFNYIDKLFNLIKPTKLVYMAIDGVAPRAKMNQQRSRRFRSAKDQQEAMEALISRGENVPENPFDSNTITPGTGFMHRLTKYLHYFVRMKMQDDVSWQSVDVILSGAECPGEGEHKIMEYIRWKKSEPGYQPNVRHCLYGLDADLIMLGLVSHEPHFSILRETIRFGHGRQTFTAQKVNHKGDFQLLSISLLREYLERDFMGSSKEDPIDDVITDESDDDESLSEDAPSPAETSKHAALSSSNAKPANLDLERIVDDFVFLCMLVGNDFIPHMPTLDIRDGGLNRLLQLYKDLLPSTGYLTHAGNLNYDAFQAFCEHAVVCVEDAYVRNKMSEEKKNRRRVKSGGIPDYEGANSDGEKFRLHYYTSKFKFPEKEVDTLTSGVVRSYVEGLVWTMKYYYNGCASWQWYYPYYYAPLITDIRAHFDVCRGVSFPTNTRPFSPLQQLLAVLPPKSAHCLPESYQAIMVRVDSPVKDMYPDDIEIDREGTRFPWEGVVLVPFIDEDRLLECIARIDKNRLTAEERERDRTGIHQHYKYIPEPERRGHTSVQAAHNAHEINFDTEEVALSELYESPFPDLLPDLLRVSIIRKPMPVPVAQTFKNGFQPCLVPGTVLGTRCPAAIPSLMFLDHEATLDKAGVNVFGAPSKKSSVILSISKEACGHIAPLVDKGLKSLAAALLGKHIYVDYPHLKRAIVKGVWTKQLRIQSRRGGSPVSTESDEHKFGSTASSCLQALSNKGIRISQISVLLEVRRVIGLRVERNLSRSLVHADESEYVPLQCAITDVPKEHVDVRFKKVSADEVDLFKEFRSGTRVVYLGQKYFGCTGVVTRSIEKNGAKRLQVSVSVRPKERSDFITSIIDAAKEHYLPEHVVVKKCGLDRRAFYKLVSSVRTDVECGSSTLDVGLNIKFGTKMLYRPGFSNMYGNMEWQYAEEVVDLLQEYKKRYPSVIDALASNAKVYMAQMLFPGTKEGDPLPSAKVTELSKWIDSLPSSQVPLMACTSHVYSKRVCTAIQQHVDKLSHGTAEKQSTVLATPSDLSKPLDPSLLSSVGASSYSLGHRVISLAGSGSVPFGIRGTVIGVHGKLVEVLFDTGFVGGSTLNGRCPPCRGMPVLASSLYNLTENRAVDYSVQDSAAHTHAHTHAHTQAHAPTCKHAAAHGRTHVQEKATGESGRPRLRERVEIIQRHHAGKEEPRRDKQAARDERRAKTVAANVPEPRRTSQRVIGSAAALPVNKVNPFLPPGQRHAPVAAVVSDQQTSRSPNTGNQKSPMSFRDMLLKPTDLMSATAKSASPPASTAAALPTSTPPTTTTSTPPTATTGTTSAVASEKATQPIMDMSQLFRQLQETGAASVTTTSSIPNDATTQRPHAAQGAVTLPAAFSNPPHPGTVNLLPFLQGPKPTVTDVAELEKSQVTKASARDVMDVGEVEKLYRSANGNGNDNDNDNDVVDASQLESQLRAHVNLADESAGKER
eukprot:Rmarinus@m.18120